MAFCDFWPFFCFPPMSPVWTPQGLRKGVGGCRGLAGMLGISGCPPLSLFLPVALTVKLGRGVIRAGQKQAHTNSPNGPNVFRLNINLGVGEGMLGGSMLTGLD